MHDPAQAHAIDRFLRLFAADLEKGGPRPLAAYQQAIPGHEALIAANYAELTGAVPEAEFEAYRDPRMPERLGPYVLEEELGRGGQAIVYLARHQELGQQVALKVLRGLFEPEQFDRFLREARIASKLQHPHICPIYFAGSENGLPYLVMERIRGDSLAQHIRNAKTRNSRYALQLPGSPGSTPRSEIDATVQLIEMSARAVHEAHLAGVTHRDLNPNNILVREHGEPAIVDFGLARGEDEQVISHTGGLMGTCNYLAPEQLSGQTTTDPRIDVWSLGVTLFEALTGIRPFDGPTDAETQQRIRNDALPHPRKLRPDLPPELVQCLRTALSRELSHRYQSAHAFAEDLQRVRERRPILARPIPVWLRALRLIQRHPGIAAVSSISLLIASVLLYGMLLAEQRTNQQIQEKLSASEQSRDAQVELLLEQADNFALRGSRKRSLSKLNEAFELRSEAKAKFEVRILLKRARLHLAALRLDEAQQDLDAINRLEVRPSEEEEVRRRLLELDLELVRDGPEPAPDRARYQSFASSTPASPSPSDLDYLRGMQAGTIEEATRSFGALLRRRPSHFLGAYYRTQLLSQQPDDLTFRVALAQFDQHFREHPLRGALQAPPLERSTPQDQRRFAKELDELAARHRLRRAALLHPLLRDKF